VYIIVTAWQHLTVLRRTQNMIMKILGGCGVLLILCLLISLSLITIVWSGFALWLQVFNVIKGIYYWPCLIQFLHHFLIRLLTSLHKLTIYVYKDKATCDIRTYCRMCSICALKLLCDCYSFPLLYTNVAIDILCPVLIRINTINNRDPMAFMSASILYMSKKAW
jgi:hypothetical protein